MPQHMDLTANLRKFLRRCTLTVEGEPILSQRDCDVFVTVLGLRIQLLSDLLTPEPNHRTADIRQSVMRTLLSYKELDVAHYVGDWQSLREVLTSTAFLSQVGPGGAGAQQAFKQLASTRVHYRWTYTTTALLLAEESWFCKANQWVTFDSRMNLPDLDLSEACCRGYLEFEADYPAPKFTKEWLNVARRVADDWLHDFEWRGVPPQPRHGPGASLEVGRSEASQYKKNKHFLIAEPLRYYVEERFGEDWELVFFQPTIVHEQQEYCCELVCVPKTPLKNRTISKESTTLQFLQQDLRGLLMDHLTRHPEIPIYLRRQDLSRQRAMRGSVDGAYDTIDLSNASDSVSCSLLDEVIGETPVYYPLMATRSEHVLVKWRDRATQQEHAESVRMKKFAPMGSATCFPVESILFSIGCETAVRVVSGTRSRVGDYLVYGDDIVIRHEFTATLLQLLEEWGFAINYAKSFTYGPETSRHIFREACGIECLSGVDVTPLRVSRRFQGCFPAFHELREVTRPKGRLARHSKDVRSDLGGDRLRGSSPGVSVGQCDLVNRAFLYGYRELRWQLCQWLRPRPWYGKVRRIERTHYIADVRAIAQGKDLPYALSVPYFITEDGTGTNFHTRRRYNRGLQRMERRFMYCVSRPMRDPHDENSYFSWVLAHCENDLEPDYFLDNHGMITTGSRPQRWDYGWLPEH